VAFGGRTRDEGGRSYGRGYSSGFAVVPGDISGGWDHGRVHEWHNHRYGWRNNGWVIIDGGIGDYDTGPDYTTEYTTTFEGGLAASVQQALDRRGYHAGPADGVIGPQTRDAIASFQSDHGLNATGDINGPLLSALGLR